MGFHSFFVNHNFLTNFVLKSLFFSTVITSVKEIIKQIHMGIESNKVNYAVTKV